MKKLYSFLTGIVMVILILWGISHQIEASMNTKNSDKLVIYNWGDYIDPELLQEFTKETGIQVQYDTFDSNEAMYTKIKQGGTTYDIAIPSEYMIAKMMDEHLVEKLDQSKIKGMENIDPDLLKEFTKETGIQVQYDTFDSNEAMYTKIKQGGTTYDIAIPSEYMIAKMMDEHLVEKLDQSKIKGMENIDPKLLNQSFDPGNQYSVPYFWGTLGIVYNTKMVKNAPEHWSDLWREEYRNDIMMYDGAREVMGIGLNTLGYSLNEKDPKKLQEAVDKLYTLTPNIKALVADEMKGYMIQNNAAIGVTFSGEASQMLEANKDLRYVVPTEASNLWFDNIVIPKTVKNKEAAYAFINFMLRPKNALKNALYVGYSTPNKKAKAMLPKEIQDDQSFYPSDETLDHLEVYQQLGKKLLGVYNDLYLQVKMYRK